MAKHFNLTNLALKFVKIAFTSQLILLAAMPFDLIGQPAGYYDPATGKTGSLLQQALHNIIKNHTVRTYTQLWTDFQTTDQKTNGKVWDMYSDNPSGTPPYEFTFISDQCGSYTYEGDCYNREHSWPNSWWGGGSSSSDTMYTDLFHLYPTDGKVNNERGNYPFGEVGSASWTSLNGSKVGTSSTSGYTGTVFEPIDEYKGDFARSQMYMAVRYASRIAGWQTFANSVLNGTTYPAFDSWYITMLLQWHADDPVSQKEIDRNDDVYGIQGNRNPFIDHPEYANQIWSAYAPVKPEPINHVAEFSARKITLQWTDATGAVLPAGYLIRMSSIGFSSIADPVDGVEIAESSTDKHVAQGTQTCTFTDLQGNTTYYFKIYSYMGSGTSITYKTDGVIPQTSKKTN